MLHDRPVRSPGCRPMAGAVMIQEVIFEAIRSHRPVGATRPIDRAGGRALQRRKSRGCFSGEGNC